MTWACIDGTLSAVDWFDWGVFLFMGPLATGTVLLFTGIPLGELGRRAGVTGWSPRWLALPGVLLWVVALGSSTKHAWILHHDTRAFAPLLAAAHRAPQVRGRCASLAGTGVLLDCDGSRLHPAHAWLGARRGGSGQQLAWIAHACVEVDEDAALYGTWASSRATDVEVVRLTVTDGEGEPAMATELRAHTPDRIDARLVPRVWRLGPREIAAALAECLDGG